MPTETNSTSGSVKATSSSADPRSPFNRISEPQRRHQRAQGNRGGVRESIDATGLDVTDVQPRAAHQRGGARDRVAQNPAAQRDGNRDGAASERRVEKRRDGRARPEPRRDRG